mgnify:CR=1 FL=1
MCTQPSSAALQLCLAPPLHRRCTAPPSCQTLDFTQRPQSPKQRPHRPLKAIVLCTQRAGWPPRRQPLATVVGRRRGMRPRRWRCQLRAAHPRRSAALRCLRARGRGRSAWRGLPHAHARCVHAPRCGGGPSGGNPLSFVVWVVCLLRPWPPLSPQRWPDLGSLNSVVGSPRTAVRTFPGAPEADAPEVLELRTQVPPAVAALEDGGEHSYGTVRTVAGPTDRPLS